MRDTDTYEVDKELKSISVFLADIPKNNILLIPEGYMDEVEEHILSQIFLTQIIHRIIVKRLFVSVFFCIQKINALIGSNSVHPGK